MRRLFFGVPKGMLLLLLGLLCQTPARAQFWDTVYRLLNGDSTQGPDYDTAYVVSYRDDLVLSPVMAHQSNTLSLDRRDGRSLDFSTNTPVQYGLALDYKWLGVEYTTSIAGVSTLDTAKGTTTGQGFGFGYTGRSWWFRNFIRSSTGFYVEDPTVLDPEWEEGDPYPVRGDLENLSYGASINHGFNSRRFSQTAALWQMERQKRSAGSFTAGGAFWYTRSRAAAPLFPVQQAEQYEVPVVLSEVRRWTMSITGGYTHTFAFWQHGFFTVMVVPGLGAQQQQVRGTDGSTLTSGWDLAATGELRMGLGYVGDRWYLGLTSFSFASSGNVSPEVTMGTGYGSVRLAAGWRIKGAGPFIPALGL